MRRLALLTMFGVACTSAAPEPAAPQPEPPAPVPETTPPPRTDAPAAADVEAMALRCDGAALLELGASAVAAVEGSAEHPSARLLASWERVRTFADGAIDPGTVEAFVVELTDALDAAPPMWWVDTLKSARGGDHIATGYDLKPRNDGDRRGAIESGPGGLRTRPNPLLVASGDSLAYDLSMGRVKLGRLPDPPGAMVEVARARAGTTIYVASFDPGMGGFRFPLRAIASDGSERWTTEVCAADRKILGGLGYQIVELVVLEDPPAKPGTISPGNARGLAVFTAESHGVTVEVFDLETGKRTLAWSSDLWSWRDRG